MIEANSYHIKSTIITTATSDNIVVITRANNNPSINNCTIVNKGIIIVTIDFVYSRESNNASIWSINRVYYSTNKTNYNTNRLNFWIIGLKIVIDKIKFNTFFIHNSRM